MMRKLIVGSALIIGMSSTSMAAGIVSNPMTGNIGSTIGFNMGGVHPMTGVVGGTTGFRMGGVTGVPMAGTAVPVGGTTGFRMSGTHPMTGLIDGTNPMTGIIGSRTGGSTASNPMTSYMSSPIFGH